MAPGDGAGVAGSVGLGSGCAEGVEGGAEFFADFEVEAGLEVEAAVGVAVVGEFVELAVFGGG